MLKKLLSKNNPDASSNTASGTTSGTTALKISDDQIWVEKSGQDSQPLITGQNFSIDISDDAKCQIARKIARLMPDLVDNKKLQLLEYTIRVLRLLCTDQLVRVREILSEELKDYAEAPHDVMKTLAMDDIASVAVPVLECSPVLTDQDLVEIIRHSAIPEAIEAIAGRKRLSVLVSDAIVRSNVVNAISRLIHNEEADISDEAFDTLADKAKTITTYHEPMITRPDVPMRVLNTIARYVSDSLIKRLRDHKNLPASAEKALADVVQQRIHSPTENNERSAKRDAEEQFKLGLLDADSVEDALELGDYAFVKQALSLLSEFDRNTVERILKSDNAKAITALCWQAKLPMRHAMQVQVRIGRIHHAKMLHARNGREYPITPQEMEVYLDIFRG